MQNSIPGDLQAAMLAQLKSPALFNQAAACALEFLAEVLERPVFPSPEQLQRLSAFDEELPRLPADPAALLDQLHTLGSPAAVSQLGGRYFGFVNGSSVPAALAAKWLADVWDQNAALYATSPLISKIETVCERWVGALLGLPPETAAGFVSGSSTATLCGLAAGRNALLLRQGWDAAADGLFGAPPLRVILGEQAHATVYKALNLLGLGRARVETVPADAQGRLRADCLPPLDERCLVIAQAGNVNTGAFDPFEPICAAARAAGAWVHVDGAFGLWAAASPAHQSLTRGIAAADSWSVDAHKTLNAPYDSGIILCKERTALLTALQISGSYIHVSDQRDNMHYTPEMSRRARAVELWATLKSLGSSGVAELVGRLCAHAQSFAELLRAAGFEILNEVVFNQVLLRCASPDLTRAVLAGVQSSGECWCGGTLWQGQPAIRLSVCSWATTAADIQRSATAFRAAHEKAGASTAP